MDVIRILLAIILPPLGVFLQAGIGLHFWLNILLTLLGYIPGIVHAIWIIARDRVIGMKTLESRGWKLCLALSLCLFVLGIAGCSQDAEQLFEVAEFEEKQSNLNHARQLYERIIEIDPNGYFATKARERLAELDKKSTE